MTNRDVLRSHIIDFLTCSVRMGSAKSSIETFLVSNGYSCICISSAMEYLDGIQRHGSCLEKQIDAATEFLNDLVCVGIISTGCGCFKARLFTDRILKL